MFSRVFRLGRVATLALLVLGSALLERTASGAAAATPVIDNAELAARIQTAGSDEERYQALLAMAGALGFGVYSSEGTALVRGAEVGPGDFYFYDFELRLISGNLGRGDRWKLGELGVALAEMGVLAADAPLSAADLRTVLTAGVQSALASPSEPVSAIPLLVRELGLRGTPPFDMAANPPVEAWQLNALQHWLILADFSLGAVREQAPVPMEGTSIAKAAPAALSSALFKTQTPPSENPCETQIGGVVNDGVNIGKWVGALREWGGGLGKAVKAGGLAAPIIDAHHGALLAYGVEVKELDEKVGPTHYGHDEPGQQLRFRIRVRMVDDLPEAYLKCGWLAGVELPKKGPIEGVEFLWLADELKKHGAVICDDSCKKTGADGIATLVFQPRMETKPVGMGFVIEDTGIVTGIARYQSKFSNLFGRIAQFLTPKQGATRWFVEYHQPPRFRLDGTVESVRQGSTSEGHVGDETKRATFSTVFTVQGEVPDGCCPGMDAADVARQRRQLENGWNIYSLMDMQSGRISISSTDSHPGTTYACPRVFDDGGITMAVTGKAVQDTARLHITVLSKDPLNYCLAHTNTPVKGGVLIQTGPMQFSQNDGLTAREEDLLPIALRDGATARITRQGEHHGENGVQHTITWDLKLTMLPPEPVGN